MRRREFDELCPVQASICSGSSGIMGIIVIDSSSEADSVWVRWVSCSLRVPAQSMVHPIIQRNTAIGRNSNLISRLRIWFSRVKFWGRMFELCCLWLKLCEVVINIGWGLAVCCTQAPTFFTPKKVRSSGLAPGARTATKRTDRKHRIYRLSLEKRTEYSKPRTPGQSSDL